MQLSEKEIEDLIFTDLKENYGALLRNKGFLVHHANLYDYFSYVPAIKWLRQLNLGPYGILDLVGYYRFRGDIHIELIELKAVPIKIDDFEQISRYQTGITQYIHDMFRGEPFIYFHKYLVGNGFDSGHYLSNHIGINVIEYAYSLEGIQFKSHGKFGSWHRPDAKTFNFTKTLHNAEEIHGYR